MELPDECRHCGYALAGIPWSTSGRLCPECGRLSPLGPRPAPWSVRHPFAFDGLLLCGGVLSGSNAAVAIIVLNRGADLAVAGGALDATLELAIIWGSPLRRRLMSPRWCIWHSVVACVGAPIISFGVSVAVAILWFGLC